MRISPLQALLIPAIACTVACGSSSSGGDGDNGGGEPVVPDTYNFESRFEAGSSSVSYSGQTLRQVLVSDLTAFVNGLTEAIDAGELTPAAGDVVAALSFYYDFDSDVGGDTAILTGTDPASLQVTYDDISTDKDLNGKIAGNDPADQHKDWSTEFEGWEDPAVSSPESLVRLWFEELDALAVGRANGEVRLDPTGAPIENVYVTEAGLDLGQLLQKFLLGAVNFSQGTDDYLDDAREGAGLNADNVEAEEGKAYTALEHNFDEGFGYWGAARNYLAYTDDEIAGSGGRPEYANGSNDANGDGAIDFTSEYNFSASVNAAKRDRGSSDAAPTDFTEQTQRAFLTGRAIITAAEGALTDEQRADLAAQRDIIVAGWENAIAATVIHYFNDTLQAMGLAGTENYDFGDHAKVWSELKGFALSLQFNPRSALSDEDFRTVHELIGQAPALPGDTDFDAYAANLNAAKAIVAAAYGFDAANVGDATGENGW